MNGLDSTAVCSLPPAETHLQSETGWQPHARESFCRQQIPLVHAPQNILQKQKQYRRWGGPQTRSCNLMRSSRETFYPSFTDEDTDSRISHGIGPKSSTNKRWSQDSKPGVFFGAHTLPMRDERPGHCCCHLYPLSSLSLRLVLAPIAPQIHLLLISASLCRLASSAGLSVPAPL